MRVCDVERLGVSLLPVVLRRSRMMAYVGVMLSGVGRLMTASWRYGVWVRYRVGHNAQVCKMRSLLNDRLDAERRRIYICDAVADVRVLLVYARERNRPLLVGVSGVMIPPRGYDVRREVNFVVAVPVEWRGDEGKVRRLEALVNGCKLASKRYRIEYV